MAKFCIYCGKPLEEGATCDCPQAQAAAAAPQQQANPTPQAQPYQQPYNAAPNPAVQAIGSGLKSLLTIVNKPVETMQAFVKASNFIVALILMGAQAIIAALFSLVAASGMGGMVELPKMFFMTFGFSILLMAVLYGALFLLVIIFKGKTDAKTLLCVVAIRSTVVIPFMIVGLLVGLASLPIGLGLFFISEIFALFYMVMAMKNACNLPDHLIMYVVAIAAVIVIIAYALIFQGVAKGLVTDMMGNMFGGLGSSLSGLSDLSDLY